MKLKMDNGKLTIVNSQLSIHKGQSLIEVVIALAVFALTMGAIIALLRSQFLNLELTRRSIKAMTVSEEGAEALRTIRDRAWSELTAGTHGLTFSGTDWSFQGSSDTANGFTRTVTITDRSATEKDAAITTTWSLSGMRPRTTTLTTILTNWRNISAALLSGDWLHPQTLGSVDLGPGASGTGLAVRSGMVYLTATASDAKKSDFFIVDATDGLNPVLRGNINTGLGLNTVAVGGSYAYVASRDSANQLQIINISNPISPTLTKSFKLTGNGKMAMSVAASGNYAYVGTLVDGGPEFFVVNISTPSSPTITGSLEIGDDVNDIFIYNDRIFLASAKDNSEFIIVNATDPAHPTRVTGVNIPGDSEEGKGVYVNQQNNRAYIVRTVGGNHTNHHELAVIDETVPDQPVFLGSLDIPYDVNSVFVADNLAFLATSNSNEEFRIYNISNPEAITYYSGFNFPQVASDLAFENNTIYVSVRSNDALRIITSQ